MSSAPDPRRALLLIDHGSRVPEANQTLEDIAALLRPLGRFDIIVAAHMELAAPCIAEGLGQCLESGATEIVALPYFLVPGRHSASDIPRMVAEAVPPGCGARIVVAEPLGLHAGLLEAALQRAEEALRSTSPSPVRAMCPARRLLRRGEAALVVVDIQDSLLSRMFNREALSSTAGWLLRCLRRLEVPILVSAQYVKGLGPVSASILEAAGDAACIEKMSFGCFGDEGFRRALPASASTLLLCGMETHICVLQTALGALESGRAVAIVADAVGARLRSSHEAGLARAWQAGAQIVTAEMAVFELLERAGTEEFRSLLPLIKQGPSAGG